MSWAVILKESVIDDLRWFGKKDGRLLLTEAEQHLSADIILVGEKRGNSLIVQGEEFTGHESDTSE